MRLTRALRLGLRREVLILLPAALFILTLLAAFTLWQYRNAVLDLAEERRAEALVAAVRLAGAVSADGLPSSSEFSGLAPQAARLALLDRQGRPILEVGSVALGDQLAPFRDLDLSRAQALGPGGLLPNVVSAVAPAVGGLRAHYVRVDLRADRLADELDRVRTLGVLVFAIPTVLFLVVVLSMRSLMVPYETMLERAREARPDAEDRDEMDFLVGTFERALSALHEASEDGVEADIAALERTLGPSLESGLLLLDRHASVLSLNPVGALMLGRPPSQPGTPLDKAIGKHPELLDVVREVVDSGQSIHRREVSIGPDDDPRTLGLTAHALRRDDGHVRGYLVLFADLTEARLRAEEEQLATSLTQVGELAAGVAHEMRNSLATVKGYLRLVEKAPDEESITDYLSEINRESDHLQRVLEDFLSFARPGTTRLETLDLTSIAQRAAADPALEGFEVRVEFERDVDAGIKGDPQLLERAVRNLLHNAAEAERRSGGTGPLKVDVRSGSDGVTLLVEDRGPGIPEDVRRRLFRPFSTGRADGVGLGLALARRIVDMHGGRLSLEARPLGGTRAVMEFPARHAGGLERGENGEGGAPVLPSGRGE